MTTATTSQDSCFAWQLEHALQRHNVTLSQQQQQLLTTHFLLLQQWNKVHNLTRVCTAQQAIIKHYIDSLLPLQLLQPLLPVQNMLDIGTGAGFPGIVAAALWPKTCIRLLDSCRKKCSFLQAAVAHMQLPHVCVQHGTAPRCDPAPVVLSRATFSAGHVQIAMQCLPPGSPGFVALWVTPQQIAPMCQQLQRLHVHIERVVTYTLAQQQERAVVVVRHSPSSIAASNMQSNI